MRHLLLILLGVFTLMFCVNCEKDVEDDPKPKDDKDEPEQVDEDSTQSVKVDGGGLKGPYNEGKGELYNKPDSLSLNFNGNFHKINIGNDGFFTTTANLTKYVSSRVKGSYYNEIQGKTSEEDLTLEAVTKIDDTVKTINANVITHIEFARVSTLVQTTSFDKAKKQTSKGIFSEFEFDTSQMTNYFAEEYDLVDTGYQNSRLLAISSILQGWRDVNELSSLVNQLRNDYQDGDISNSLGSKLLTSAYYIKHSTDSFQYIVDNLNNKHQSYNPDPAVNQHIQHFINNSSYSFNMSRLHKPNDTINRGSFYNHNLIKHLVDGTKDTIVMGNWDEVAAIDVRVPVGETLTLTVTNTTPSSDTVAVYDYDLEEPGWQKSNNKFTAIPQYPNKYSTGYIDSKADYYTINMTGSFFNSTYSIVIDDTN